MKYCRENNCKGFAAISAGVCPDIKDPRTINRRLSAELSTGNEKDYGKVLTNDLLVQFRKKKSQALQPA